MTVRGIMIATDLVIRNDRFIAEMGNMISYTSKVITIVASIISNNVLNYMDASIVIVLLMTSPFIIMVNSNEVLEI